MLDVALLHIVHGRGALGAMVPLLLCTFALAEAEAPKTHLRRLSCSLGAKIYQAEKRFQRERQKGREQESLSVKMRAQYGISYITEIYSGDLWTLEDQCRTLTKFR